MGLHLRASTSPPRIALGSTGNSAAASYTCGGAECCAEGLDCTDVADGRACMRRCGVGHDTVETVCGPREICAPLGGPEAEPVCVRGDDCRPTDAEMCSVGGPPRACSTSRHRSVRLPAQGSKAIIATPGAEPGSFARSAPASKLASTARARTATASTCRCASTGSSSQCAMSPAIPSPRRVAPPTRSVSQRTKTIHRRSAGFHRDKSTGPAHSASSALHARASQVRRVVTSAGRRSRSADSGAIGPKRRRAERRARRRCRR